MDKARSFPPAAPHVAGLRRSHLSDTVGDRYQQSTGLPGRLELVFVHPAQFEQKCSCRKVGSAASPWNHLSTCAASDTGVDSSRCCERTIVVRLAFHAGTS